MVQFKWLCASTIFDKTKEFISLLSQIIFLYNYEWYVIQKCNPFSLKKIVWLTSFSNKIIIANFIALLIFSI